MCGNELECRSLDEDGLYDPALADLVDQEFDSAVAFSDALQSRLGSAADLRAIVTRSRLEPMEIDAERVKALLVQDWLTEREQSAVIQLRGRRFRYPWQLGDALAAVSKDWYPRPPTTKTRNNMASVQTTVAMPPNIVQMTAMMPTTEIAAG